MRKFLSNIRNLLSPAHTLKWNEVVGWVLACCVFLTVPLGQLTRVTVSSGKAFYLHEFFMLPALVLLLPLCKPILHGVWSSGKLRWIIASFAWILLGIVVAFVQYGSITPGLYLIRLLWYVLFCIEVGVLFNSHPRGLRTWLLLVGIWYWWLAILQYILLPDTRFLWLYGWDDHYYRMIGTVYDPGLTGILVCLTAYVTYSVSKKWLIGKIITAVLLLSCILTYSRASYMAITVSLLYLVIGTQKISVQKLLAANFYRKNARIMAAICLVSLSLVFGIYAIIPKPGGEGVNLLRTSTITARIHTATEAVQMLKGTEWILGRGLFTTDTPTNTIVTEATEQGISSEQFASEVQASKLSSQSDRAVFPDSIFILLLTQTGVIGLISGVYILYLSLRWLRQREPLLAAAVVAVMVQSQFNNTLLHPYIVLYLGLFIVSYLRFTVRDTST